MCCPFFAANVGKNDINSILFFYRVREIFLWIKNKFCSRIILRVEREMCQHKGIFCNRYIKIGIFIVLIFFTNFYLHFFIRCEETQLSFMYQKLQAVGKPNCSGNENKFLRLFRHQNRTKLLCLGAHGQWTAYRVFYIGNYFESLIQGLLKFIFALQTYSN